MYRIVDSYGKKGIEVWVGNDAFNGLVMTHLK